ncbi:MAG TPA: hypothetical protein VE958_12895 [Bryobacteraceae bacterium]|nr:hypothetical protein [Bryobacteraceae bacterium]
MKRSLMLSVLSFSLALGTLSAQTTLTNSDLVKLSKAGLSEDFVLNLIDQQGSRLATDPSALITLKNEGVNERIISAAVRKSPSREPLNTDSVVRLVQAGFSDRFVIDLLNAQPAKFTVDASRIVDLKQAGVSERILALMVQQGSVRELPSGTQISVRLIDPVDSDKNNQGDEFRASLEDPITMGNDVVVQKGADAKVRLVSEQESGKLSGRAGLTVQLVSLTVDGKTVRVDTSDVSEYSGSRGARTAKSAAAVGAVGAIIGAIAGGGKGAAIGAGAGAAAGAGAQTVMKGQQVRIPSETVLTFTTQKTVQLP